MIINNKSYKAKLLDLIISFYSIENIGIKISVHVVDMITGFQGNLVRSYRDLGEILPGTGNYGKKILMPFIRTELVSELEGKLKINWPSTLTFQSKARSHISVVEVRVEFPSPSLRLMPQH